MTQTDALTIALDESVRTLDAEGRMHIRVANISKANVCGYFGREIPGCDAMGLDPNRIYQLYRDAGELARAAHTFNNIQLLTTHQPVHASDPKKELVIGSTGTDAQWSAPYLTNSLVIWDAEAINQIERNEVRELSCGYRYVPVMVPGEVDGIEFDGRMTEIVGNHVALVERGRAGPDVCVGDEQPNKENPMIKAQSPGVRAAQVALAAVAAGKLAADADPEAVKKVLMEDGYDEEETEEERKAREAKRAADRKGRDEMTGTSPEDEPEDDEGEDEEEEDDKKKGKAMDAAIQSLEQRMRAEFRALRAAEREVRPYVGDLAMDACATADEVYKAALTAHGIAVDGVHPSAFRAMVKMLPTGAPKKVNIAADTAGAKSFTERFPVAARIRKA